MPAAIVPIAMDLIQTGVGAANKSAAKAEAQYLKDTRPQYQISPESTNELNLAESELQGGMGSRAARAYTQQSDKQISSSLSAILKGGGNINNIGDLYGAANEGDLKLAQIQDNLRLNQIQNTVNARRNYTDQRDKSFMYNQDQWWKNDTQANAEAKKNADQQLWSGINGLAGDTTNLLENLDEKNQMDKYLNRGSNQYSTNNSTGYNPTLQQASSLQQGNNTSIKPIDINGAFDPYGLNKNSSLYNLTY